MCEVGGSWRARELWVGCLVVSCPGASPSTFLLPRGGVSPVHVAFLFCDVCFSVLQVSGVVKANGALEAGRRNCGFPASCEPQSNVSRDAPVLYCIAPSPFLGMLFGAVDLRVPRMGGHFLADLFQALSLIFVVSLQASRLGIRAAGAGRTAGVLSLCLCGCCCCVRTSC